MITADEYVEEIHKRDEEARLKKKKKKEEREQKKKEKAEEKEQKQAEKEQKQAQKGKTPRGNPKKVISDSETPVQTASDEGPSQTTVDQD